ncbi:MAG: ATP-binding protein [Planctomycetota bacterium]
MLRDPPVGRDHEALPRALLAALPGSTAEAVVLTGVRRCGKSTLQRQLRQRLGGGALMNFEDTRLFGLAPPDFPNLIQVLDEYWRGQPVFLDEVQEVEGWQRLVRTLLDQGRFVCVTGSNASLLGRELGSKLTGRHRSFEVLPFSYAEFLAFTHQVPGAVSLGAWLDQGGFPAFLRQHDPQLLRELLRDVIHRDVAARHGLRTTRHVMNLALFLFANTGQPWSLQELTRALAIPAVPQTSRAVEHLQDAYLVFAVPKWSASFKKRVVAPPKYYAVDNGMRVANSPNLTPDVGHRLENAVYLGLRARGEDVCYAGERGIWECDFVTPTLAIQVCARLDATNRARELRGVVRGAQLPGRRQALVLTMDQAERLVEEGVEIDVQPAWRWLLEQATAKP